MKRKFLACLLAVALTGTFAWAKEPVVQMLRGEVIQTDPVQNQVSIGAAGSQGSIRVYQVQLNGETRLVGFDHVAQLKGGQKAEIHYFQDRSGKFVATYVELIKPKNAPPEPEKKKKKSDPEDFRF